MAKGLTTRQEEILRFISDYHAEQGYPPSIREIGARFGIGSLRGVTVHLDALEKKGCIERANTPRSIKVIHPAYQSAVNVSMLPLLGTIAAGAPILAEQYTEDLIPVPSEMVRNIANAFVLRVKGDSMTGEGINPRDLVVIKPQESGSHGELVAVLMGDEATVKRLHMRDGEVKLIASNPAYEPIEVSESDGARILGRVVGLLRDYQGMAF
ncbi:MAG: transcriptional repressor LexA [Fimbriimonadaceae bacterium]|nr:transcriptional repressor LexA [Fimbriimonadaceae bacterium]QYK52303.1 MAG: transcriptional repressor LexA [Fimbriimonadaceae bacterium]